ncbi:MAG: phosphopantothenoylcysteine decarboxylase [Sedimentisphaerales bacterium]|nr:phosphopantothenoylcysteine decarboxylase [Sedimentisphaerales bacterium]
MLDNKNILLGVTGGIAAYKAVDLASKLKSAGANIKTVMTQNACRFVGPLSFEAVTGSSVFTTMWTPPEEYRIGHVALSDWANIVVVAPASANIIAKIANGICDDFLSTFLCASWSLAAQGKAIIAPAMNIKMWENPVVQRNIETIKKTGFQLAGPSQGRLACGTTGIGRMSEPKEILEVIETIASDIAK